MTSGLISPTGVQRGNARILALGCRAVGIAGGPEKVRLCLEEFGYDTALDYKAAGDLSAAVAGACPEGVHVYFDNTAGPVSDAVLPHLAVNGRVVVCGTASVASWDLRHLWARASSDTSWSSAPACRAS